MDTIMEGDDDPRSWSIDRVVFEVCHTPTPRWLSLDQPHSQYTQNRQRLEDTFRQNDIDGDSLLALDMTNLKEDLGIASFGIRNIIMKAVNFFQAASHSHQQSVLQADRLNRMQSSFAFPSPQITQSRVSAIPQSPAYYGFGIRSSIESPHARSPSLPGGFVPNQPNLPQSTPTPRFGSDLLRSRPAETSNPTGSRSSHSKVWQTEQMEKGTAEVSSTLKNVSETDVSKTVGDSKAPPPERPRREYTLVNGRKKITPTFIEHLPEVSVPKSSGDGYFASDALPVQDVFYYKIPTNVADEDFYRVPVDESEEFAHVGSFLPGQRGAIGKLFKSYLRQGHTTIEYAGMRVQLPYGPSRAKSPFHTPHSEQYFTLFRRGAERAKVQRLRDYPDLNASRQGSTHKRRGSATNSTENAPTPTTSSSALITNSEGTEPLDFGYLLAKYPVGDSDVGLPLYGDSGDENDYDETTWQEMEEERAEEEAVRSRPATLSSAQVEAVIAETIEEYKTEWRETKLAVVQRKAYRHWIEAARTKSRQPKIKHFHQFRDHCLQRMDKLKHEVGSNPWRNIVEVKKQCQVLEVTVHQLQEYNYYSEVMHRDTPPDKPTQEALAKSKAPKQHDLEEGEEDIESEPEPTSADDENDFIDDNSSDVGSIHHDPNTEDWSPENWEHTMPQATTKAKPSGEKEETPAPRAQDTPMLDFNADDADIESEDEIISSDRRKRPYVKIELSPQTPSRKHKLPALRAFDPELNSTDNSDLDRAPRLPKSKYRDQGRSATVPVDLTLDSSPSAAEKNAHESSTDFSVHTPKLNPVRSDKVKNHRTDSLSSGSDHDSSRDDTNLAKWNDVAGIRETGWSEIETADTRRALAKAVYSLQLDHVIALASFLNTLTTDERRKECIVEGLAALDSDEFFVRGVPSKRQESAELLTWLYLTYCLGENTLEDFELSMHHRHQAYEDKDTALEPFYETLAKIIQVLFKHSSNKKGKKRKRDQAALSDRETLEGTEEENTDHISSDLPMEKSQPSSHRKRKRKVAESQEANSQQYIDKIRTKYREKRRAELAKRFADVDMDGTMRVIVNTEEPLIQLHERIAARVKPHQITGLQFMWREIIEDPKHQGCILAHTMGLGKTFQVIALLVTISACNHSDNQKIRELIPPHLRNGKTLILCPASLLNNWEDELLMWTPKSVNLGQIYKCDSSKREDNINAIQDWSRKGGVLLMGYERFQRAVAGIVAAKQKKEPIVVDLETILLDTPSLIIADEAHSMKNSKAKVTQLAKRFRSNSRIALTGSPLNNHLEEYHTMVDWIAPNYLGDIVQFRDKYSEPIQNGLYADSSVQDKRKALRRLHVLKRDLDAKINRADISAIAKDMPPKTEYFITVPLTELQRQAYDIYVQSMLGSIGSGTTKANNTKIWEWTAMLGWLCHHPSGFVKKLLDRETNKNGSATSVGIQDGDAGDPSESSDDAPIQDDVSTPSELKDDFAVDTTGPLSEAMEKARALFPGPEDVQALNDPALSYRTVAVKRIVEKALEAGDKTLIFSHSIPTLSFLADMLATMNCPFLKITGQTKASVRQAHTKHFNERNKYKVFLISMRAGGLGLNLQGANRVVIFDFSFNPTWEQQAIGRAYRLNQKRPVFVYRFRAGGTFEDRIFNTSVFKTQLFGRVVDKKNPKSHASKLGTDHLFPAKDVPQEDFSECIGKDPKVLDAIIDELDFVRNIVMTETFQKEDDEPLTNEEREKAEEEYENERLKRDDPLAWQLKMQAAFMAEQERQRAEQQRAMHNPYRASGSTLPIHSGISQRHPGATPTPSRSSQYNLSQPPFGREDIGAMARPNGSRPIQTAQPNIPRGSFDDTFMPEQTSKPNDDSRAT